MKNTVRCFLFAVAFAALVVGCTRQGGTLGTSEPISAFPVYTPSTVVASGKYDDSDEITKLGSNFFGSGDDAYKPFIGVQELIKTGASLDDLNAWLKNLVQSPPPDLYPSANTIANVLASPAPEESSPAPSDPPGDQPASGQPATSTPVAAGTPTAAAAGGSPSPAASGAEASPGVEASPGIEDPFAQYFKPFGLVPAAFWTKDRGRVVMIIIMDPKKVADELGPTLPLIDQYEKLPTFMRGGLDDTIKKQTGFSITDLTNTNTPMGMIVYAARNFKGQDTRAIILVDAVRQPNSLPTPHASGS